MNVFKMSEMFIHKADSVLTQASNAIEITQVLICTGTESKSLIQLMCERTVFTN